MDFWDAKSVDFSWKEKTGALHKPRAYDITRVCHLEMQNGVLCGLRFRCKYALCLVFTAFDFFENIYLHENLYLLL